MTVTGCRDRDEDLDDNNNRLIEVHTLDELALLRDDLNGDGADDGRIGEITAMGNAGCPSSGCLGYELNRSLNFNDAGSYATGSGNMDTFGQPASGWKPIGSCSSDTSCSSYTGTFDGNGHSITDLLISA